MQYQYILQLLWQYQYLLYLLADTAVYTAALENTAVHTAAPIQHHYPEYKTGVVYLRWKSVGLVLIPHSKKCLKTPYGQVAFRRPVPGATSV